MEGVMMRAAGDIGEYREVVVHFKERDPQTYLVHGSEVAKFARAFVRLHHDPVVNPYNGGKTEEIWQITSAPLCVWGPFWWTTRTLADDGTGARFVRGERAEVVWVDRAYADEMYPL